MSNTDSFIDEVNEDLKRERMMAALRRYGWIVALVLAAVIGGVVWNEWNKARSDASAQAFGDAVFAALNADDADSRRAALAALNDGEGGARATGRDGILRLLEAGQALETGDRAAALTALAEVAANAQLPDSYRQLATLKQVIIAGAEMEIDARRTLLQPLAAAGQPFRPLALEQLALLQVESGETEAALASMQALLNEADVTAGMRERVEQMILILGGSETDFG